MLSQQVRNPTGRRPAPCDDKKGYLARRTDARRCLPSTLSAEKAPGFASTLPAGSSSRPARLRRPANRLTQLQVRGVPTVLLDEVVAVAPRDDGGRPESVPEPYWRGLGEHRPGAVAVGGRSTARPEPDFDLEGRWRVDQGRPRATGALTEWLYPFSPGGVRGDLPGVASVRLSSSA